jgi:UDP-N-acetylglucosamine--N-acetylmuramyl-(pentapeptide) pyrophosphoryl-undecaprenol N-acetylglucosamine transferase
MRLYFSIQNIIDQFKNFLGLFVAIIRLYIIYPDVVFSKGGFASVPIYYACRFLRIPLVIHESDSIPGRANKLAGKYARYVGITYSETAQYFDTAKTALVGIPLRKSIYTVSPDPLAELSIENDLPLIYVTGGSLGAERINNLILRSLDELLPNYRIFHQVGGNRREETILTAKSLITNPELQNRYYVAETVESSTVGLLLQAASLVITRAGSTTLAEIAVHAKPSIIIPIPEDISRDQKSNAYAYARGGGAVVLEEHNLTESLLVSQINSIIGDTAKWQEMGQSAATFARFDSATQVANILIKIGQEHGS